MRNFCRSEWYLKWILKDGENSRDLESPLVGQKEGCFLCVRGRGGREWAVTARGHTKPHEQEGPGYVQGTPGGRVLLGVDEAEAERDMRVPRGEM